MNSVMPLLGMRGILLDTVLNPGFVRRASFCPPHSRGQEEAPPTGWYIVRFIINESQTCYIRNKGGSRNFYWGGGGKLWFTKDCCFSVAVGAGNTALRAEANRS